MTKPHSLYSAENASVFIQVFGSTPQLRIIDFFLDNPLSDYSKNEIVKNLGMGRVTFFKYWKELEKSGAVKVTRSIGRATMYQLARQNKVVKQLVRLDMALASGRMDKSVKEYEKPVAVTSR